MLCFRDPPAQSRARGAGRHPSVELRVAIGVWLFASVAVGQPSGHPAEKVRVTYQGAEGCPTSDEFLGQVRARIGTAWEAPSNELARTIEVRVTSGADRSVARIDFVDENSQPITRVVTAKTCDEVVTGIALVTALAIESRIAEAVGKSEPAAAQTEPEARAPEAPAVPPATPAVPPATPPAAPVPPTTPSARVEPGLPPHYDVGAGALVSPGVTPGIGLGFRGFIGFGWAPGPDFRLGGDFVNKSIVTDPGSAGERYAAEFQLALGRASACPVAFGNAFRLLPCGGVEIGEYHAEGIGPANALVQSFSSGPQTTLWFAPFASVRAEASVGVLFVELEGAVRVAITGAGDYKITTTDPNRPPLEQPSALVAYHVSPVSFGAVLAVGLRL